MATCLHCFAENLQIVEQLEEAKNANHSSCVQHFDQRRWLEHEQKVERYDDQKIDPVLRFLRKFNLAWTEHQTQHELQCKPPSAYRVYYGQHLHWSLGANIFSSLSC